MVSVVGHLMNPLNWLPTLFEYFENLCIRIATKGWHRPGFYLSTLFTAPVALYLHRKDTRHTGLNIILKIVANVLLIFSFILLLRLWIFLLLLPLARIVKFVYDRLRIGEPEIEPILPPAQNLRKVTVKVRPMLCGSTPAEYPRAGFAQRVREAKRLTATR